jgi:hypothetical protein
MRVINNDGEFAIVADRDGIERLLGCVLEATQTLSRAEFYIRTGWAREDVRQAVLRADDVLGGTALEVHLHIPDGIEEIENPRRPRPRGDEG